MICQLFCSGETQFMFMLTLLYMFVGLGTQENDVAALVEKLGEMIPVLSCTLCFRQDFKDEVLQQASLSYIEDQSWPGLGGVR